VLPVEVDVEVPVVAIDAEVVLEVEGETVAEVLAAAAVATGDVAVTGVAAGDAAAAVTGVDAGEAAAVVVGAFDTGDAAAAVVGALETRDPPAVGAVDAGDVVVVGAFDTGDTAAVVVGALDGGDVSVSGADLARLALGEGNVLATGVEDSALALSVVRVAGVVFASVVLEVVVCVLDVVDFGASAAAFAGGFALSLVFGFSALDASEAVD
jgi:hypothetical protein